MDSILQLLMSVRIECFRLYEVGFTDDSKPTLFVGSSTEGLDIAQAVQVQLSDVADVELWNEGVLGLSYGTLESLVKALNSYDFAVLVFTPDDFLVSRDNRYNSARDNVLIEAGLFIGRLGRERTFLLSPADAGLKVPSDFAGITFATFSFPQDRDRLIHAVGPACVKMRNAVRKLGKSAGYQQLTEKVDKQARRVDEQAEQISSQQAEIRALKFSLQGILTQYEFDKLLGLERDAPFMCYYSDDLYNELKRLRAMQLVGNCEGVGLSTIRREYKDRNQQFDLKRFFFITNVGREYLLLRKELARDEEVT